MRDWSEFDLAVQRRRRQRFDRPFHERLALADLGWDRYPSFPIKLIIHGRMIWRFVRRKL